MTHNHEFSEFNTGSEIFSAWILSISLIGFVMGVYYFTIVRVPARPILDRLFAVFTVPVSVQSKLASTYTYVKSEGTKRIDKYMHKDMKPLKTEEKQVMQELRGTSEDMGAAIIGAPLEDDFSSYPSRQ